VLWFIATFAEFKAITADTHKSPILTGKTPVLAVVQK